MNRTRRTPLGDIGNTLTQRDVCKKPVLNFGSPRADDKHRSNPLFAVDYVKDVYDHFRRTESKNRPSVTYMSTHTEITEKMRAILIDWLVDVHLKFRLLPETLFLTVDIIDRYLEQRTVPKLKLQLVGVVAMLLGAKYEEMYPPEIKEFLYVSADAFTRDDVLRMERQMLAVLNFNLTVPTTYPFLQRGLQVCDADKTTCFGSHYLAEMCLVEYKMLLYLPSTIAASCIYVAGKLLGNKEPWPRNLEHYSGYKMTALERCSRDILDIVRSAPTQKLQAVTRKYGNPKYFEVSKRIIAASNTVQIP